MTGAEKNSAEGCLLHVVCGSLVGVLLAALTTPPWAQDFPAKPIRILTAEVGGGADFLTRLIAQGLTTSWGQPVVVDNRGGNVSIPAETVAKAAPDGYTLLFYSSGLWTLPLIQTVPFDPIRDFVPVTLAVIAPNMIVVHPSLPVRSVKELITLAKAKPGQLNYSTGALGSAGF